MECPSGQPRRKETRVHHLRMFWRYRGTASGHLVVRSTILSRSIKPCEVKGNALLTSLWGPGQMNLELTNFNQCPNSME